MSWFKKANTEKQVFIMRGPSGSGKSTLIKSLLEQYPDAKVVSADFFYTKTKIENGVKKEFYDFKPEDLGLAHSMAHENMIKYIKSGVNTIIVDNTNINFRSMKSYVKVAIDNGYKVKYIEPSFSKNDQGKWDLNKILENQKSKERVESNKSLPNHVVERMVNSYDYKNPNESDDSFTDRILKS